MRQTPSTADSAASAAPPADAAPANDGTLPPRSADDGAAWPARATSVLLPTRIAGMDHHPVAYRRALPPDTPLARYPGFAPGLTLLKKGTVRREGALPLPCDIVFERDVALQMRDGVTIYADVFRPADDRPAPAIVAFSPYGKQVGGQHFDDFPGRAGVPLGWVSELQRFEGPDPALYVDRGYVVVNPDPRGAYQSEGHISYWGRQTGEDGHDIVEWLARQPWCDGRVGMAGNSWLAVSQWFIAAERPPHLAAIAPWEGNSDYFRTSALRGGIPFWGMTEVLLKTFAGNALVEDLALMVAQTTGITPYWQDKAARLEAIEVPAYVVASYVHPGHTAGTFEGFRRIGSARKWLRVHNTGEWHDFNLPAHQADLLAFFDHVLKGADNGWDRTPTVRLSVLDPGGTDTVARPEAAWPLARQRLTPLYLAEGGALVRDAPAVTGSVGYAAVGYAAAGDAAGERSARFTLQMAEDTEITGYLKARLWVQADGADDMDLNVSLGKLGSDGLPPPAGPHGPPLQSSGVLRVSRRELDAAQSTPSEPRLSFGAPQPLGDGQIVPVDIEMWPIGLWVRAGEFVVLTVRPHAPGGGPPFRFGEARVPVPLDGGTFAIGSRPPLLALGAPSSTLPAFAREQHVAMPPPVNRGRHVIHFGAGCDSHVLLPIIPSA